MLKVELTRSKNKSQWSYALVKFIEAGSPCWGIFQIETPRTSLAAKLKVEWPRSASKGPRSYRSYHFFLCLSWTLDLSRYMDSQYTITTTSVSAHPSGSDVILLWLFNKIKNADCPKANLEGKYDLAQWSGRLPREYYCREYSAFEERWTQPGPTVKLHRSSLQGGCGKVRLIGTLENERSQEVEWDLRQS